jgi:glycosyltransferase involved in cell wall biosynthesis
MPVRDAGATLGAALDSILAQAETAWELIAIDDGSTDASVALLQSYAARDPRVRLVFARERGLVAALNAGLAAARAPFVARMDADDVALPDRLGRQRRHLEAHPALGLVASRVVFDGDRVRGAGYARYVDWANTLLTDAEIRLARFVESPFAHPSVMYRRSVVDTLGGYRDGDVPEDYELWLRWLDAAVRMEKLAAVLLRWRDRPDRLSRHDPRYSADAFDRVRARYLARWLSAHNPHHPDVVVWGAGRTGRRRARALAAHGIRVAGWIDIDPRKFGRRLAAAAVIAPDRLPPPGRCFVVSFVAAHDARDLIATRLDDLGYRAGEHYLLAA